MIRSRSGVNPARLWSNRVLRVLGALFQGEVVNVSGWDDRDKEGRRYRDYFPKASGYYVSNHHGPRGVDEATDFVIDLTAPPAEALSRRFDVVLSHTTLEHIFDVGTAFHNLCELSRDVVIVVVPFVQRLHGVQQWGDFWRFTPMSLRRLFENSGLRVIFEAASADQDQTVYLIAVGSRNPERWRGVVPAWQQVDGLGDWIGVSRLRRWWRRLRGERARPRRSK